MPILINAYCTHRDPPAPAFPHGLNARRDRSDPELGEHLRGFAGYVASRGDGEMTAVRYHVLEHVRRVRHHLSLNVEQADLGGYAAWARVANAISFLPDGTVRDPAGAVLVYPDDSEPDEAAELPYPGDARARKAAQEQRLAALGVETPPGLPPVVGEVEVELRPAAEVARRALALLAVALRGESLAEERPLSADELRARCPGAFAALTPAEAAFLAEPAPERQQVVEATWRYEALAALEWALGLAGELPFPSRACQVDAVARALQGDPGAVDGATLRPAAEVLDALDLHYRLHWAVRQAKLDGRPPPGGLIPGVVGERHQALNWLVRLHGADWDEVDTPT